MVQRGTRKLQPNQPNINITNEVILNLPCTSDSMLNCLHTRVSRVGKKTFEHVWYIIKKYPPVCVLAMIHWDFLSKKGLILEHVALQLLVQNFITSLSLVISFMFTQVRKQYFTGAAVTGSVLFQHTFSSNGQCCQRNLRILMWDKGSRHFEMPILLFFSSRDFIIYHYVGLIWFWL